MSGLQVYRRTGSASSIECILWAWEQKVGPHQKLVLLYMAGNAGGMGSDRTGACADTGLSAERLDTVLRTMLDKKIILPGHGGSVMLSVAAEMGWEQ